MAEENWGDDFQEPVKRSPGVPRWIWTCGCGCLIGAIALVLAIVAGWDWFVERAESLADPAQQWPLVSEVLPVEEPPEGVQILKLPLTDWLGLDVWFLADRAEDLQALLMTATGETGDELTKGMFEGHGGKAAFDQPVETEGVEQIVVQGRELRAVRFLPEEAGEGEGRQWEGWQVGSQWGDARGAGVMIDVSSEDGERTVLIQLVRESSTEPLTDDEVRAFLEPFVIGDDR